MSVTKATDLFLEEQGAKAGSRVADDIMERCFRKGRPEGSEKKAGRRVPGEYSNEDRLG